MINPKSDPDARRGRRLFWCPSCGDPSGFRLAPRSRGATDDVELACRGCGARFAARVVARPPGDARDAA